MSLPATLRSGILKLTRSLPRLKHRPTFTSHTSSLIVSKRPFLCCQHQCSRYDTRYKSNLVGTGSIAIFATTFFAASVFLYHRLSLPHESSFDELDQQSSKSQPDASMAVTALPGRPGNLTADQEEKLQEMWTATLSVFGVTVLGDDKDGDAASMAGSENPDQADQQARTGTLGSEKKKKKRINMFGRKTRDGTTSEDAAEVSTATGDDKYGQAKAYHKLLDSQSPEDLRKAFWSMVKHDNPDGLLLRFLRARKWNVQNALIMLVAAMHWRMQEMHVDDDIIKRGEGGSVEDSTSSNKAVQKDAEDFLAQMRLGKSFLHGTDREGRPMCFVRVRLHKQGEQTESSLERYTVYTIETARYLLSSNVDTAVSRPL